MMIYHGTKQHLKQIQVHGHDLSHVFFETKHIMNELWKVDEMEVKRQCHVTCF